MRSKKWMVLSLFIGTVLLMAVATANILYTEAVLQRLLTRKLDQQFQETNTYPFVMQLQVGYNPDGRFDDRDYIQQVEAKVQASHEIIPLPQRYQITVRQAGALPFVPDLARERDEIFQLKLSSMTGLEDQVDLIDGSMFTNLDADGTLGADGVLDVIVPEQTLIRNGILLGETLTLDPRGQVQERLSALLGTPDAKLRMRIAGVFRAKDNADSYWYRQPSYYGDALFVHPEVMEAWYGKAEVPLSSYEDLHYIMPDYTKLTVQSVAQVTSGIEELNDFMGNARTNFRTNVLEALESFSLRADQIRITLTLLQFPVYLLLLAYIFMVSGQLIGMEQDEIAVFKSRGASRTQILRIYFFQGLIVTFLGALVSVPLAYFIVQVLGSSSAFMSFVGREGLSLNFRTPAYALMLTGTALLSLLVMVIPGFKVSRVSIVEAKQHKRKGPKRPLWKRIFLDIILMAVALYARYTFSQNEAVLAEQIARGFNLDALLFLASSLFLLGAALFTLRILPWVAKVVFWAVKRFVGPALYVSFLSITRTTESRSFISVFLVLTVALGIFSASAARSVNVNGERDIAYRNGADLVVKEPWESNADQVAENPDMELVYQEPDATIFGTIDAVKHYTRVYHAHDYRVQTGGTRINDVQLMAIHTKEFGETATPLDGLTPEHLNTYLNALGSDARGILLSENFREVLGVKVNDSFSYYTGDGQMLTGIIRGFVPYFPGYQPQTFSSTEDGRMEMKPNYLIVANLSEIQRNVGLRPYELWFDSDDQNRFIYDFSEATGREFTTFKNTYADIIAMRNDPSYQGLNGILTVSFVVILVLAGTGFLIFWILSIRRRTLTFGIQRAMGMPMPKVIAQLFNEQLFVTVPALLVGAGIGLLSAWLFVPLIQTAYAAADQTLPLIIDPATDDLVRLAVIIGLVMLVCMMILGLIVKRMKVTQALKLGED